jgi:hypothetical protein
MNRELNFVVKFMRRDAELLRLIRMLRVFSHSTLLVALAIVAWGAPSLLGQADTDTSAEFSAYGGAAFGIGSHAAVGGGSAIVTPYVIFMLDVGFMPFGNNTLRNYHGTVAAQNSRLYDFSVVSHIRIPLRSPIEPYGIVGGGLLHNTYDSTVRNAGVVTVSRKTDDNFGFHTGGGLRYYVRSNWGVRAEYRVTISNQVFSRVFAGLFYQFD